MGGSVTDDLRATARMSAARAVDRGARRWMYALAALVVVSVLALGWFLLRAWGDVQQLRQEASSATAAASNNADAAQRLAEQVRQLGQQPVVEPPQRGEQGQPGRDGKDGQPGKDGKDGLPGKDGERGHDGVDGKPGIDGKDGKDGVNGKDGEKGDKGDPGGQPSTITRTYPNGTVETCQRRADSTADYARYDCTWSKPDPIPNHQGG